MTSTRDVLAGASIGLLAAGARSLRPSLTPRSTLHQALVTGVMGATGAVAGAAAGWVVGRAAGNRLGGFWVPAVAVAGSGVVGGVRAQQLARQQDRSHQEWGPQDGHLMLGAAAGLAGAAGFVTAGALVSREVRSTGTVLSARIGGPPLLWSVALGAVATQATAAVIAVLYRGVMRRLAEEGRQPDRALEQRTDDDFVSGGPKSAVDYDSLSREGRRFVAWRVGAGEIARAGLPVVGEPVRVFVGVDTVDSVSARVDLAVAELDRLGAFERAAILAVAPAGTGYANSVPVEALELLTGGDCAAVAVQYGVLPSMWSRGKLPLAAETFRALIDRIHERTQAVPEGSRRPRLFLYGESLGAQAAEVALRLHPSLVDLASARVDKVSAALFVGTPGGPSLRDDLGHHPNTVHADRWQALPHPRPAGPQLWFLEHDADPVTKFRRDLMYREPAWLQDPRGRNVPEAMRWEPVGTWQQVLIDVAYATQAQSGVFRSVGHDYRADLGPLVAAAFAPDAWDLVAKVQQILADREVKRDRLLAAAEGEAETAATPAPADVPPAQVP